MKASRQPDGDEIIRFSPAGWKIRPVTSAPVWPGTASATARAREAAPVVRINRLKNIVRFPSRRRSFSAAFIV